MDQRGLPAKNCRRRRTSLLQILVVALSMTLAPVSPLAQRFTPRVVPPPDATDSVRWGAVLNLVEGTMLEVERRAGGIVGGSLQSVDADRLVLNAAGGPVELLRTTIGRIVRLGARTTARSAKRGFVIGAVIGATQGALTVETNRGAWIGLLAAIEGSVGAVIGALHGAGKRERILIYEAAAP